MDSFIISGNSITYHSNNDNLVSKAIDMDCDIIYNKYSTTVIFPTIQALQYYVSDLMINESQKTSTADTEFYKKLSQSRKTYFSDIFDNTSEDSEAQKYTNMMKVSAQYYKDLSTSVNNKEETKSNEDRNYDFLRQMNNCNCGVMLDLCEDLMKQSDFSCNSDNVTESMKKCKCKNNT